MTWELEGDVAAHYEQGVERERLTTWGLLEAVRTREMFDRFLPPPPAVVLDVGGAEGAYALPLARSGSSTKPCTTREHGRPCCAGCGGWSGNPASSGPAAT